MKKRGAKIKLLKYLNSESNQAQTFKNFIIEVLNLKSENREDIDYICSVAHGFEESLNDTGASKIVGHRAFKAHLRHEEFTDKSLTTCIYYLFEKGTTPKSIEIGISKLLHGIEITQGKGLYEKINGLIRTCVRYKIKEDEIAERRVGNNNVTYNRLFPDDWNIVIDSDWKYLDEHGLEKIMFSNEIQNGNSTASFIKKDGENHYNSRIESPKNIIYNLDENSKPFKNESLKKHYKKISKKFSYVKLPMVENFKLPIKNYIKLPLRKVNEIDEKRLNEKLDELKFLELSLGENNQKVLNLKESVNNLKNKIEREYDISKLIKSGRDIFIESPAGTGKTTLLRWIAYRLTKKENPFKVNRIPIYLELRFLPYNFKKRVENQLNELGFDAENSACSIMLLIDGYDEFSGDCSKLIEDICELKQNTNAQIILSGREIPNFSQLDFSFTTYKLNPFSKSHIEYLFSFIFPIKGKSYFEFLESSSFIENLSNPLYLMLLISHIKNEKSFNKEQINEVLTNFGILLKTVLVDNFILNYEIKGVENTDNWEHIKRKQINVVSYIAYFLTFKSKNKEVIKMDDLEDLIDEYISKEKLKNVDAKSLIQNFIKHNIFEQNTGLIVFGKKEIRLFFTALYLSNKIGSYQDFLLLYPRNEIGQGVKKSIEKYLFGIINPKKLVQFPEGFKTTNAIYSNKLFKQLTTYIQLLHYKNIRANEYFSEYELTSLLSKLILFFEIYNQKRRSMKAPILLTLLAFTPLKRKRFLKRFQKSLIDEYNFQILYPDLLSSNNLELILEEFLSVSLSLRHNDIIKAANEYNKNKFYYLETTNFFDMQKWTEKVYNFNFFEFMYNGMLQDVASFKNKSYRSIPMTYYRKFIDSCWEKYASEFISYYILISNNFNTEELIILREQINYLSKVKIDSHKFLPGHDDLLIGVISNLLKEDKKESEENTYKNLIKKFDSQFIGKLFKHLSEVIITSKNDLHRINATSFFVSLCGSKQLSFLKGRLNDHNTLVIRYAIFALMKYERWSRVKSKEVKEIHLLIETLLKSNKTRDINKEDIIFCYYHFNIEPSENANAIVLQLFKDKTEFYAHFILRLYERISYPKAKNFLIKLLNRELYVESVFYALVNIDTTNYHLYLDKIEGHQQNLNAELNFIIKENSIENIESKYLRKLYESAVYIGNKNTTILGKKVLGMSKDSVGEKDYRNMELDLDKLKRWLDKIYKEKNR